MRELLLERLALADVAAVEHDASHVLVGQQVGAVHLEQVRRPVLVHQGELEHLGLLASQGGRVGEQLPDAVAVGGVEQLVEAPPDHSVGVVPEQPLDRRALVADRAVGADDGDEVAGVADQRAEARLAAAAVHLLGELCALERRARPARRAPGARCAPAPPESPAPPRRAAAAPRAAAPGRGRARGRDRRARQARRAARDEGARSRRRSAASRSRSGPRPAAAGTGCSTRDELGSRHCARGGECDVEDLVAAGGGHEVRAGSAQHSLRSSERSCWRIRPAILMTTRPNRHDRCGADDCEVVVAVAQVVDDPDRRAR